MSLGFKSVFPSPFFPQLEYQRTLLLAEASPLSVCELSRETQAAMNLIPRLLIKGIESWGKLFLTAVEGRSEKLLPLNIESWSVSAREELSSGEEQNYRRL